MALDHEKQLAATTTPIPGFLVFDLTVHGDNRGWFKENWQRAKMTALGLPDFGPVQNNISFNDEVGVTRGIHAEPWDKFISVATGRVFGAWVDLREGPSFGTVFTCEIDPGVAVYVPRGVGNAYQTLEPNTAYSYLVNAHWSPEAKYTFLNLADETVAINWPIPLSEAILSDKDKGHPRLDAVTPFPPAMPRVLVTGAHGQLGRALMAQLPDAGFLPVGVDLDELNIADRASVDAYDWTDVDIIVNAAAWTNVDGAETPRRSSPGMGRQCDRAVQPGTGCHQAWPDLGAYLVGVHLTAPTRHILRKNRPVRWASMDSQRPAVTPLWSPRPGISWCAPAGWWAWARTSWPRWPISPRVASHRRWLTTRSAGSPSPRTWLPASFIC